MKIYKHCYVGIYLKKAYSKFGISELIRIVNVPYEQTKKQIISDWATPEYINKCYIKIEKKY